VEAEELGLAAEAVDVAQCWRWLWGRSVKRRFVRASLFVCWQTVAVNDSLLILRLVLFDVSRHWGEVDEEEISSMFVRSVFFV
jgi:hypothetical protein